MILVLSDTLVLIKTKAQLSVQWEVLVTVVRKHVRYA